MLITVDLFKMLAENLAEAIALSSRAEHVNYKYT
jgi:hypothetical protein